MAEQTNAPRKIHLKIITRAHLSMSQGKAEPRKCHGSADPEVQPNLDRHMSR